MSRNVPKWPPIPRWLPIPKLYFYAIFILFKEFENAIDYFIVLIELHFNKNPFIESIFH